MKIRYLVFSLIVIFTCSPLFVLAHVSDFPSVHDHVAALKQRLINELSPDQIVHLSSQQVQSYITEEEREVFSKGHLRFTTNVPVTVYVFKDEELDDEPFWLEDRNFEKLSQELIVSDDPFEIWKKDFDQGRIGLGINSFRGGEEHYFVALKPLTNDNDLQITNIYPGQARLDKMTIGARAYVDDDDKINRMPEELQGLLTIRTMSDWRDDAYVLGYYQKTDFPSSPKPDQIVLTWSDDPATTQTIQWRTDASVQQGMISFMKKSDFNRFHPLAPTYQKAESVLYETDSIVNDKTIMRHTVMLKNLEPDTTYVYSIGDGSDDGWTELAEFTTAPNKPKPFSFIYMGDAQNGLDRWGILLHNAFRDYPEADFYVMAGDLVNRGNERWDWDQFFESSRGIYNQRTLVPAIGNHECQNGPPQMYLDFFALPDNGPVHIPSERVYSLRYSNALFLILDSNITPAAQAEWIEDQLKNTDAIWKFVVYHHPAYSSRPTRDNPHIRDAWIPLFDQYHVDMALQGHDHAYLRTYPMNDNEPVDSPNDGTIYIVSVSGVKMYDQADRDYTAHNFTNTSTFQVLDIQINGDRLVYRAIDIDGNVKDEIVIEKSKSQR